MIGDVNLCPCRVQYEALRRHRISHYDDLFMNKCIFVDYKLNWNIQS